VDIAFIGSPGGGAPARRRRRSQSPLGGWPAVGKGGLPPPGPGGPFPRKKAPTRAVLVALAVPQAHPRPCARPPRAPCLGSREPGTRLKTQSCYNARGRREQIANHFVQCSIPPCPCP
jgi:hypothetical protein